MESDHIQLRRTAEWIEREYGREKWPAVERDIADVCGDEGPAPVLSRVVSQVMRRELFGNDSDSRRTAVFGGLFAEVPPAVVIGAHQELIVDGVISVCTAETDLVVELGAGWGRNILSVWMSGGPLNARYIAAEYTASGRRAAETLAALEPRIHFEATAFDYYASDFEGLGEAHEAVVFTVHSVEQIPQCPEYVIDCVRSLAPRVTCLHFEPVGWQAEVPGRAGSSREYAETNDYNRNLVSLLRAEETRRNLTIESLSTEVIGINPRNATTVVRWSAVRGV